MNPNNRNTTVPILAVALLAVLAGGLLTLGCEGGLGGGVENKAAEGAARPEEGLYTCPMHPTVVQKGPGTCPICKMDLLPMKSSRSSSGKDTQEIPADPGSPLASNGFEGMPEVGTKAFCPVMKNEFTVKEDSESSVYQGKHYAFCCPGCKPTFEENPQKFITLLNDREARHHAASSNLVGAIVSGDRKPKFTRSGKEVVIDPVVVQNMGVRVAEVERGSIFRHVRTLGEILVAEDQVSVVNLRFNGWIEKIYVDQTGQKVEKGQKLFSVYSPELVSTQDEYLLAVRAEGADGRLARSTARRLELWGISKGYLAKIASTGKTMRHITIAAPRSGYVLHKNVVQGARVQAGSDLYRIGDLDRIWVNAEVYEHDAAWVRIGQKATMELSFQQGKSWEGTVSYVYPTLNAKTRTLTIRLEFENPGLNMKPGMLAIVRIESQKRDRVITVPSEAVIHSGERRLVFVATGYGHYQPREIITGLVGDNNRTEVLEGVTPGEQVVVSGQFMLDSESQLQEAVAKLLEARLQARTGKADNRHSAESQKEGNLFYWTCGMHPEVVQEGPGTCPQCGMDLVKKTR
ncbi:MAG: efflux RND transporter periplasmic adaptor subunit [Proteobacteria bacterium]|nr:efflux RND transporter periplasmic adaptor subunit [Pseudomonadota bacterium]